jgi:uncharacterized protein (DUF305 family)
MKRNRGDWFRCNAAAAFAAATLLAAGPALAQQPGQAPAPRDPGAMMQSMDKMNKNMAAAPMTGDVDHDFVAMMIPHHQGAIDMAKVELAGGKDPRLRKLATDIVAAQQREIRLMRDWQARHPAKPR